MDKVLVIAAGSADLKSIKGVLENSPNGCSLETAQSCTEGLRKAKEFRPHVIVLDGGADCRDCLELCSKLKAGPATRHIPIIMRVPADVVERHAAALESSTDTFLLKPVDEAELLSQIKLLVRLQKAEDRLRQKRGELKNEVQKKTQDLSETAERYRRITAVLSDFIMTVHFDRQKPIDTTFSSGCDPVTGYSPTEFSSDATLWLRMINKEDRQRVQEHICRVFSTPEPICLEYRIMHKNGNLRWVRSTPVPHSSKRRKTNKACDFLISDITAHKLAGEEKAILENQLRQAHKMEAIGTLAGGIAHDFNNILGAIIGYTGMAIEDVREGSQEHYNMEQVLHASYRARDLIKQILAFSRQTDHTKRPVTIGPIIRETLKLLRASLPKTIEIRQNIPSGNYVIVADPTAIHQVLLNLCTNAYHAMRESGGVLEISVTPFSLDEDNNTGFPELRYGPYIKMTTRDSGCGMERAVLERVFDPFFTTKSPADGTGMGLSVVHGIVKSYGGAIRLDSLPGHGSTFEILLPRIKDEAQLVVESAGPLPGGDECILFVDDEEVLVEMTRKILERLGYTVIAKTSSVEALEAFRDNPAKFNMVITDYTMPGMTGAELSKELMNIRPDIPIILCTGFSERITKEKSEALGIREFVMKPVVISEIAPTLRRLLD